MDDVLHNLILDSFPITEDTLQRIYDSCGLDDQEIFKRLKNASQETKDGELTEEDINPLFPEIRITLSRLREMLSSVNDYESLTKLTRDALTDIWSREERNQAKELLRDKAKLLTGRVRSINEFISIVEKDLKETALHADAIQRDDKDRVKPTIQNFIEIMKIDSQLKNVWFDEVKKQALNGEVGFSGSVAWQDVDDDNAMKRIEQEYEIYHKEKYYQAFRILMQEKQRNPIKDKLKECRSKWDGKNRCADFLCEIAHADNSQYIREISQRIFDAAVNRLMVPGCKCDEMPVLIGEQGSGKSTLIEYLAFHKDYYTSLSSATLRLDRMKETLENMKGFFIIEFAEFFSPDKRNEQDALKDFITKEKDTYRTPYDRIPQTYYRNYIFIGSTNNEEFLTDLTGNRRFLPVHCKINPSFLFDHEKEVREYIEQCYGEAVARFEAGERLKALSDDVLAEAKRRQESAMVEDYRKGIIREYVQSLPHYYVSGYEDDCLVCGKMVWEEALQRDPKEFGTTAQRDIKLILRSMPDLLEEVKSTSPPYVISSKTGRGYGQQKCFKKIFK